MFCRNRWRELKPEVRAAGSSGVCGKREGLPAHTHKLARAWCFETHSRGGSVCGCCGGVFVVIAVFLVVVVAGAAKRAGVSTSCATASATVSAAGPLGHDPDGPAPVQAGRGQTGPCVALNSCKTPSRRSTLGCLASAAASSIGDTPALPQDKDLAKYHAFLVATDGEGMGLERENDEWLTGRPTETHTHVQEVA
eukprot:365438-Chlamydomonas_euryale.AAC.10